MKVLLQLSASLAVVAVAGLLAWWLIVHREEPPVRELQPQPRLVRAHAVELKDVELVVESEGTVRPRRRVELVPEVTGSIVWVSPSWVAGGFFSPGEALLRIDASDYETVVVRAKAEVAQAQLAVEREAEEAEVAMREWIRLGNDAADAPDLVLRKPQLAEKLAGLAAAEASLRQAELDLARTTLRAPPYRGRILEKSVDLGQYVTRGAPVATAYSIDEAEVMLPIADSELAYVDLPLDVARDGDRLVGPEVEISADFAGREYTWKGHIVRTAGEIDPRTRRVRAIAEIEDPYASGEEIGSPPLTVGLFVRASIRGRRLTNVAVLPRHALRDGRTVLVIDDRSTLRSREVTVARADAEHVYITEGLSTGELVCVSMLDVIVEGMPVRVEIEERPEGRDRSRMDASP